MNHTTSVTTSTNATLGHSTAAIAGSKEHERMRDFCAKLCKIIGRYATPAELEALVRTLDAFKRDILSERYSPGLNDAAYDLFAAFNFRAPASRKPNDQEQS